jgi:cell division protein FtsW (lipid II flippase)
MSKFQRILWALWSALALCFLSLHLPPKSFHNAGPSAWGLLVLFLLVLLLISFFAIIPHPEGQWFAMQGTHLPHRRRRKRKSRGNRLSGSQNPDIPKT